MYYTNISFCLRGTCCYRDPNWCDQPTLQALKAKFNASMHRAADESFSLQETLDRLSESIADKVEELDNSEASIRKLSNQHCEEKNVRGFERRFSIVYSNC